MGDIGSSLSLLDFTLQLEIPAKGYAADMVNVGVVARQLDQADIPNEDLNKIVRALVLQLASLSHVDMWFPPSLWIRQKKILIQSSRSLLMMNKEECPERRWKRFFLYCRLTTCCQMRYCNIVLLFLLSTL